MKTQNQNHPANANASSASQEVYDAARQSASAALKTTEPKSTKTNAMAIPIGQAYTDATQSAGFGDHYKHVQYGEFAFTVTTPPAFGLKDTDALCDKIAVSLNEHDALLAIEKALGRLGMAFTVAHELAVNRPMAENALVMALQTSGGALIEAREALLALQKIREGK